LRAALERLNRALPPEAITSAVDELTRDRSAMSLEAANREVYLLLQEGIKVSVPESDSTPHPSLSHEAEGRARHSVRADPIPLQSGAHGVTRPASGGQKTERLRVVDWEQPANNDFLLVRQFSVTGAEAEAGRRISEE
jgi:type I restriction enzyme R subunit